MVAMPAQAGQGAQAGIPQELYDEKQELIPVGVPYPPLGPQPPGPIIVQRDPVEIAASRQSLPSRDVTLEESTDRDVALESNPRPAKQLKIDALSSHNVFSLLGMEHEDEPNATCFDEEDIDMMEEYDNMLEEELEEGGDFSAAVLQIWMQVLISCANRFRDMNQIWMHKS